MTQVQKAKVQTLCHRIVRSYDAIVVMHLLRWCSLCIAFPVNQFCRLKASIREREIDAAPTRGLRKAIRFPSNAGRLETGEMQRVLD